MLRRADNIKLSRDLWGRVKVQVGKKRYTLTRTPKRVWTADRARQHNQPVLVLSAGDHNLWQFQNRFYWDNDLLDGGQVHALLVVSNRGEQQGNGETQTSELQGWVTAIATVLSAIAAGFAVFFAYKTVSAANSQIAAANGQIALDQRGQVDEQVDSATANLGSDTITGRTSGIIELQAIMQNFHYEQPQIIRTLSSFIRARSGGSSINDSAGVALPSDVQLALTVLADRNELYDAKVEVDLSGANLESASLGHAYLANADLSNTDLSHANLTSAMLDGANLQNARLEYANLDYADLNDVDLAFSDLKYSYLQPAYLKGADLTYANMHGAQLNGHLTESAPSYAFAADLEDAKMFYVNLTDANLNYALLNNARLSGAKLMHATIIGANLSHASLGTWNVPGDPDIGYRGCGTPAANLAYANLDNAILNDAVLYNVSLIHTAHSHATFSGSYMQPISTASPLCSYKDLSGRGGA